MRVYSGVEDEVYEKKGLESEKIFLSQSKQENRGRGIRKKGILYSSTIFQNTRILEIIKIFVSHHSGRA